jgi:hypothetical protein
MTGCSQTTSEAIRVDSSAPARRASAADPVQPPTGLYTDEEIRKLAPFDIDKESGGGRGLLDIPFIDVVPEGESYPRSKVFKTLNIDEARIRDFRQAAINLVVFLTWQVSPSYDICCMTAINDPDNDGLQLTDPRRKVYGVRFVKRSE